MEHAGMPRRRKSEARARQDGAAGSSAPDMADQVLQMKMFSRRKA
jgi:hypothetical protein